MNNPKLPAWVAPVCCISPFVALIGFSVDSMLGGQSSTPSLICLVVLCGKIISAVVVNSDNEETSLSQFDQKKLGS